ncbi:MAG: DUF1653 domain-containing protein [Gemmatimonadota bacterium]
MDERKPYPKSSCTGCGRTVFVGLNPRCTRDNDPASDEITSLRAAIRDVIAAMDLPNGYENVLHSALAQARHVLAGGQAGPAFFDRDIRALVDEARVAADQALAHDVREATLIGWIKEARDLLVGAGEFIARKHGARNPAREAAIEAADAILAVPLAAIADHDEQVRRSAFEEARRVFSAAWSRDGSDTRGSAFARVNDALGTARAFAIDPRPDRYEKDMLALANDLRDATLALGAVANALNALASDPTETLYRHYKGGIYRVLHRGEIEADLTPAVIYQAIDTGRVWVRPAAEFDDGRFTPVPRPATGGPDA